MLPLTVAAKLMGAPTTAPELTDAVRMLPPALKHDGAPLPAKHCAKSAVAWPLNDPADRSHRSRRQRRRRARAGFRMRQPRQRAIAADDASEQTTIKR